MRLTLVVVLVVTAALAAAGHLLSTEPAMMSQKSGLTALDTTNRIGAKFGQTTALMIVARAKDGTIVDTAVLASLDAYNKQLQRSGVCKSVISFFALPHMIVGEEETEIRALVEKLPANEQERAELKKRIETHPNAVGELVSPDLTRALFICPLLDTATPAAQEALAAASVDRLVLTRVDPAALGRALGSDLMSASLWFLVLALVISITGRPLVKMRAALLAEIVLLQAGLVYFVHPIIWPAEHGALAQLLGPSFDRVTGELDEVTGAGRLLLIDAKGDFNTAKDVNALAAGCAALAKDAKGKVSCPTDVLITLSGALTGDSKLPATDEQLKALWFLAGERPELSLLFPTDKQAALVRVRLDDPSLGPATADQAARAFAGATIGGLPLVDAALGALRWGVIAVLVLAMVAAFFVGRRFGIAQVALGEAFLAPALLVKVALVSRLLMVVGLVVLFLSVGARSKRSPEETA